jgi:hypothetical protein
MLASAFFFAFLPATGFFFSPLLAAFKVRDFGLPTISNYEN